jgi:hypothetical protein
MEIQREVSENVEDFASGYVRFIQKRARLYRMTGAVRSLEVRKFGKLHCGFGITSIEVTLSIHACRQVAAGDRFRRGRGLCRGTRRGRGRRLGAGSGRGRGRGSRGCWRNAGSHCQGDDEKKRRQAKDPCRASITKSFHSEDPPDVKLGHIILHPICNNLITEIRTGRWIDSHQVRCT